MVYSIKTTKDNLYAKYLMVINGTLHLSEKEILILGEFMKYNEEYKKDPEVVFSAPIRKKVQQNLKISSANLNNYIQYLKNKKVIEEKERILVINKAIIPLIKDNECSVIFKFTMNE